MKTLKIFTTVFLVVIFASLSSLSAFAGESEKWNRNEILVGASASFFNRVSKEVLARHLKEEQYFERDWTELLTKARLLPPLEQLWAVNQYVNEIVYKDDIDVYQKHEYWATPHEFLRNGGDCEDYTLAKFFLLKALGWEGELRILMLQIENLNNLEHTVLIAYLDGKPFFLDNRLVLVTEKVRSNYNPLYSFNKDLLYLHRFPQLVQSPGS